MTRIVPVALFMTLGVMGASVDYAWAEVVDISGREKVEVGNWADLKDAVADAGNSGKVIVLTGDITADMSNPISIVGANDIIIDGGNHTVTGKEGTSGGQFIRFDSTDKTDLIIQNVTLKGFGNVQTGFFNAVGGAIDNNNGTIGNITGNFEGNYTKSESSSAQGGAIDNFGTSAKIGNISGDFEGNYAQSTSGNARGGAIFNQSGTISNITGDFSGNYAKSESSYAEGGAIYNSGTMTLVNSSFYDNYVETGALRDSEDGLLTGGGAIYNEGNLTIKADNGSSIFKGNKVKWANGEEDSSAIMAMGITLDSVNGGLIQFDDKVSGIAVTQTVSKDEVEGFIKDAGAMGLEVKQDGENYIVSGEYNGAFMTYQIIKQTDGSYKVTTSSGEMSITGDDSSRVVFNNAIENMTQINISKTNVDVNEGAGTISRTVTYDGGKLNINAGAKAEDSVINDGGTMNVANKATASRTEVNSGGVLSVAAGGLAENTTINSGGLLNAAAQAKLHNMLANSGAELNIDASALLSGNIIIDAAAKMGGSYDYSKIFKDEVADSGSLTLIGGLNDVLNESSLINSTDNKRLHLTAGSYDIGDGAQAVQGWDMLTFKDNATVKLEGDIALSGADKKIIIEKGSTLDLAGHSPSNYTITGSLSNDGSITFSHADDEADDITTIYGNYKAYSNAEMTIDVNPATNSSDLLKINGDVEGTTNVVLNALDTSKPTQMIAFVEAPNDDLSTGAYFNIHRIVGSPFNWNSLYKDGVWYTATDDLIPNGSNSGYGNGDAGNIEDDVDLEEDAVLPPNFPKLPSTNNGGGNPSVVGEVVAYMSLPSAGIEQTRGMVRNLAAKVENTKTYNMPCGGYYDCGYDGRYLRSGWISPIYSYSEVNAPYEYDAEISGAEAGFDVQRDAHNKLGVFVSFRQGEYDISGKGDDYYSKVGSEIDINSYIAGLYYRHDAGKMWLMSSLFGGYEDVDIHTDDGVSSDTKGTVLGGSIMGGVVYAPRKDLQIEPTLGATYTQIRYDDAKDAYGKVAKFGTIRNLELEAAVRLSRLYRLNGGTALIYLRPGVIYNMGSGDVSVTALRQVDGLENTVLGSMKLGGSFNFNEFWSLYTELGYIFGSDYKNLSFNAGLNYAF